MGMAIAEQYMRQQNLGRGGPSGLADVLEVLLDKGLVIDAFVRVSLIGIELLTIDVRVVVASVDTYLRFAEAVNRLDLLQQTQSSGLDELIGGGSRRGGRSSSEGDGQRTRGRSEESEESERSEEKQELQKGSRESDGSSKARDEESKEPSKGGGEEEEEEGILARIKERGKAF
jgi:gas vesicle structural protein